jgi:hypothetical protein
LEQAVSSKQLDEGVCVKTFLPRGQKTLPCSYALCRKGCKAISSMPHKYAGQQNDAFVFGRGDGAGPASDGIEAAMFMRLTCACGTMDAPSLV